MRSCQVRPALPASSKSFDGKDMLPPAVVSLIAGLLQRNPRDRLSAAQVCERVCVYVCVCAREADQNSRRHGGDDTPDTGARAPLARFIGR